MGDSGERLLAADFKKTKLSEILGAGNGEENVKRRRTLYRPYRPLWQADAGKIRRFAPIDFIGRYIPEFFDYAMMKFTN
jgi:hypothetical protein